MQYRNFGTLDWKVSALGFGCMRLPHAEGEWAAINEEEATRIVRYAIDNGVNYIDTAYNYHLGNSEQFLGRALQEGYREKVKLATKLFPLEIKVYNDFNRLLNHQLEKLQTDYVDFYLLHGMNRRWWPRLRNLGVIEWAEDAIDDGRICHVGFSFHDEYPIFKEIVNAYTWTLCQIQYNYMDVMYQAGTKGLQYAASKGLAVVVMGPLLGGRLADAPPPVQNLFDTASQKRTPAEWGFQWLWNQPEISVVLSGMSTYQQVKENMASAHRSGVKTLTTEDVDLISKIREIYQELGPIPCTGCNYCMPCPNEVDIPYNFKLYNDGVMYERENPQKARGWYRFMVNGYEGDYHREKGQASKCIQCQECESKCPQSIPISDVMPIVHQVLGEGKSYDQCPLPDRRSRM